MIIKKCPSYYLSGNWRITEAISFQNCGLYKNRLNAYVDICLQIHVFFRIGMKSRKTNVNIFSEQIVGTTNGDT